jgi:glutathione S-transferase
MASTTIAAEPATGTPATAVKAKLYGLPGAAPSFSAELMLLHKGVRYRRVNLIAGLHSRTLPARGFPGRTAPAAVLNGERVQTNRAIARALDELVSDPPFFPSDPMARADVEEAERFCDEVLQHAVRRMILWSLTRDPDSVRPHPALGPLAVPRNAWLRARLMPRVFKTYCITGATVGEDFKALPVMLDKLDGYVADGVLDCRRLTAADLQIAPLIAALSGIDDLGAEIAWRRVAALASRVMPEQPPARM